MSEVNTKTDTTNKNNELLLVNSREETISENVWIIRVSKTHPGLKYYFNTVTGVSLWNISKDDMERAKHTMKANQNQTLYINCTEPKEPPPRKKICTCLPQQTCEKNSQQPKNFDKQLSNSGLTGEEPGLRCDFCYGSDNSSPNIITVNFQGCPHSEYSSILDNAHSAESQGQTQPSSVFNTSGLDNNHYNKGLNHVPASNRSPKRGISKNFGHSSSSENLHNQCNTYTNLFNHNTTPLEILDLTALKMFAKNGVIKDKWYIIADADVYLHHITLLQSVVNSDKQCCLMVPHNVRIELKNATTVKELRTKAYFASYYIYYMFDRGIAEIDEVGSHHIQDKSNEEHILDCCSKLKEENFYVIVITNDIELQKYRNKIFIPIFTVAELKEYIYKNSHSVTTKSPEPTFNLSQSNENIKESTPNLCNSNVADVHPNQNVQSSLVLNDQRMQVQGFWNVSKITADAEVQTNFYQTQLEEKEIMISNSQSCEPSLHSSISKRTKLKRRKLLAKSESRTDTNNTIRISPDNNNLLHKERSEKPNTKITVNEIFHPNKLTTMNNLNEKFKENYTISNQALAPNRESIHQVPQENIECKNVMFEVTSEVMDQRLQRRSDEWVSRFVQIMEEALTQVLRKNSSLYLPPPWNMYEAAICIEKRFITDEDVKDASKKFLSILKRICDEKGNINANITPSQFMEMYSYGVYIIDALQGIFSTCEDLQSAAESLSKLLNDIQDCESDMTKLEEQLISDTENADDNVEVFMIVETESLSNEGLMENTECLPNLTEKVTNENVVSNDSIERQRDGGTAFKITFNNSELSNSRVSNDLYTFKKHPRFKATNTECNDKSREDNNAISAENVNACNTTLLNSPSRYNLRSNQKTMLSENEDQQDLSENCLDVSKKERFQSIFLSNLSFNKNKEKDNAFDSKDISTKDISDEVDSSGYINSNVGCSYQFSSSTPPLLSHKINIMSNEPKVVRKFVICPEFEDRLRASRVHDEMEVFDFEEEISASDYEDEFYYHDNNVDVDAHIEQEIKPSEYTTIDLKYFMAIIAEEIKQLSIEVYNFSKNACESLNSTSTYKESGSTRAKAEQLHFYVNKVITALTNILNRDDHVQTMLKHTEFDEFSVDENLIPVYAAIITRCLQQAQALNNTIKDVLSAVCEH